MTSTPASSGRVFYPTGGVLIELHHRLSFINHPITFLHNNKAFVTLDIGPWETFHNAVHRIRVVDFLAMGVLLENWTTASPAPTRCRPPLHRSADEPKISRRKEVRRNRRSENNLIQTSNEIKCQSINGYLKLKKKCLKYYS